MIINNYDILKGHVDKYKIATYGVVISVTFLNTVHVFLLKLKPIFP